MSDFQALHIIILAAGQGKRMRTHLPKVLHKLAGQPLLGHVLQTTALLHEAKVHVIVGHEAAKIQAQFSHLNLNWVQQEQQLGTGHAVMQALPYIPAEAQVLILSGDVPLIQISTLQAMLAQAKSALCLLVATLDQPFGFGRILRGEDAKILAIVEEKDANPAQRNIQEIYTGICSAPAHMLKRWLPNLSRHNQQQEYYLTEIIQMAVAENYPIHSLEPAQLFEIQGINTLAELQSLERQWQGHLAQLLLASGVQLADANRLDIRGRLHCQADVFLDINVITEGVVEIGAYSQIGANCILKNTTIGKHCIIHPHSVLENTVVADYCEIGPFARCRPGTVLNEHCKIGNFVETKNTQFDVHSKASHLSYLGDASVGKHVNIGAGTITCNYDGVTKHPTIIKDHAFIGSDTQLIAPVTVGEHAVIGAGTSLREDAPDHALTLTPSRQKSLIGWKRKQKSS